MYDSSGRYKCNKCGKPMEVDVHAVGIQCKECGSKIFYKQRPSIKKTLKSS